MTKLVITNAAPINLVKKTLRRLVCKDCNPKEDFCRVIENDSSDDERPHSRLLPFAAGAHKAARNNMLKNMLGKKGLA
jgi:hypothetical protein